MIRIPVEYDAYNRSFKLVDREFAFALEDRGIYELELPFMLDEPSPEEERGLIHAPLVRA